MSKRPLRLLAPIGRLASLLVLLVPTLLAQATPPSADTFTSNATPKTNYGSSIVLVVQQGATTYLQFSLATLPSGAHVQKATLRLFVDAVVRPGSFDVFQVSGPWSENVITFNTAPPLGPSATGGNPKSVTAATLNQFVLIDVTRTVQGWVDGSVPNNGLAVADAGDLKGIFSFDSKESVLTANGPELEIVLDGPQGPPGPTGPQGPQGIPGAQGPPGPVLGDLVYTDQNNIFTQNQTLQGSLALAPTGTANTSQSFASNIFDMQASVFNGSSPQLETFRWLAEPAGNNTPNASATLNLLFGAGGVPTETGLFVSSTGSLNVGSIQSPKDLTLQVTHDLSQTIGNDESHTTARNLSQTVGSSLTTDVGNNVTFNAGGNYTSSIAKAATMTVGGEMDLNAQNMKISNTGTLQQQVGGTLSTTVGSDMAETVGSSRTTSVGKDDALTVSGNLTLTADNTTLRSTQSGSLLVGTDMTETIGRNLTTAVSQDDALNVAGNLAMKASNASLKTAGTLGLESQSSTSMKATSDLSLESGGNATLKALVMNLTASGPMTLQSTLLSLNSQVVLAGDLTITGNISKGGGSFKIDHPLDPANKYLYHSFVESPDMMDVYNGNVVTDQHGLATIVLPDYFEALNRDFRYQLTVLGQFAQAIVASEIKNNRFIIKTNKRNVRVSWQVTGIRQDAFANAHRIPVEVDKPLEEQGHYLHPELFNAQPELAVGTVPRPANATEAVMAQDRASSH